jgi:GT2 family glycosyltransferase
LLALAAWHNTDIARALEMSRVLLSILNYNSFENTVETVNCCKKQTFQGLRLLLVDNASTDDCLPRLRAVFPDSECVQLTHNGGYTKGNNFALELARREDYDYVIISNEDVLLKPDFVSNLVETAAANPDAGTVGGVVVDFGNGSITAGAKQISLLTSRCLWHQSVPNVPGNAYAVPFVSGAVVLFTRKALAAGIKFDEKLFLYGDEKDLGFQLKKCGLKAYVDKRCRVIHKGRPGNLNARAGYFQQRNRVYLAKKYASLPVLLVNLLITGLCELPAKTVLRVAQGHAKFAKACIWGYMDGIRGRAYEGRAFDF